MTARTMTRSFVGALLMAGVALGLPMASLAEDAKDVQQKERQLQAEARQLNADATRAATTPDGQRRLDARLAKQFDVNESFVTQLRTDHHLSYGQATIALALSQQLMKQNTKLNQQQALDKILTERQAGKGWGVIAHEFNLKLGHVVSEVKKADTAATHIAGKPDKVDQNVAKVDKPDKPEKIEKPDKPEKPAKPEKPGR
jgi:hypothetical protein